MNGKTYVVTVMRHKGNELMEARGKRGLKALLKHVGLSGEIAANREMIIAENRVEAQVHLEWIEKSAWEGKELFRARKFK